MIAVTYFVEAQKAYWGRSTLGDKAHVCNLTALAAMIAYVSLQVLTKESYLTLVHNSSFITVPLQAISEFQAQSIIYYVFALTFFNQNLRGRVAPWQVISAVTVGGFLYASTSRGLAILQKEAAEKK